MVTFSEGQLEIRTHEAVVLLGNSSSLVSSVNVKHSPNFSASGTTSERKLNGKAQAVATSVLGKGSWYGHCPGSAQSILAGSLKANPP